MKDTDFAPTETRIAATSYSISSLLEILAKLYELDIETLRTAEDGFNGFNGYEIIAKATGLTKDEVKRKTYFLLYGGNSNAC